MSNELEKAMDLLGNIPTPVDLEQQINALYASASEDEKPYFDEIMEGMFNLLNKPDSA